MTDGYSQIPAKERLETLKALFPEIFDEDKIDWEKLKATLGEDVSFQDERYMLSWAGKSDAFRTLQQATSATLIPDRNESVDFDNTHNIFIEGDNLDALKILQRSYFRKVKMVYIDPPYNTGEDSFVYTDDFSENREDYLRRIGEKDENGLLTASGEFKNNGKDKGHYHSNWLNMMMPLMYLYKSLMKDDGVIFVSIDDNEVYNLRMLMNEVFGEENFIASIVWQKRTSPDARYNLGAAHDYILVYGRNIEETKKSLNKIPLPKDRADEYKNPDNDPRGEWASVDITGQTGHATESQFYTITTPSGKEYTPPTGRCWALSRRTFDELVKDNRIWFGLDGSSRPRKKVFLNEVKGVNEWTWWTNKEVGHNQEASKEIKALLGSSDIFPSPKPTRLIKHMMEIATSGDDIILDFFAGSGTTGDAVMQLNLAQGNGHRKCISIQIPEPCSSNSIAYKSGYETISEITRERLRRAGQLIKKEAEEKIAKEKEQLPFGDVPQTQMPDTGFKAFKVAKSNFKQWQHVKGTETEKWQEQLLDFTNSLADGAKNENVVYELMLKNGIDLNASIEHKRNIYLVDGKRLCLMLEKADQQTIDDVLAIGPDKVIALDKLFEGNDQLLTNTALQMKDGKIDFETV